MDVFAGYYEASYPPELWETPAAPVGAASAPAAAGSPAATFTVVAGAPGSYGDDVKAADRPRNITDLDERATPADRAPWAAGQYVPVGERGKRAHWTGAAWKSGESPGYPAPGTVPAGTVEGDEAVGPQSPVDQQEEAGTVPPGTVQ